MEQAPTSLLGGALFYTQPQPVPMLHNKYTNTNSKSTAFWHVDSSFISTPSDDTGDAGDDYEAGGVCINDGMCNDINGSNTSSDDVFTSLLSVTPASPSPSPLTSSSSLTKL